jgi:RHH-type proline utilization regulon transcriptional repressor/proline dehydrogenase/delta 1-pyrroline-5-carboxylate dehydrogenase
MVCWSVSVQAHTRATLHELLREAPAHERSEAELASASCHVAEALLREVNARRTPDERRREQMLARLMHDPSGQTFTTCLTDRVYRSRDPQRIVDVARSLLRRLGVPKYLPLSARALMQLLLRAGPFWPEAAARGLLERLRSETSSVVLAGGALNDHLQLRHDQGCRVNLNQLGEAVLGEREAELRCRSYEALLARPEVESISVKLSSISSQLSLLAFRDTLEQLKPRLLRIYRAAIAAPFRRTDGSLVPKLVTLDMEAYRDLELTFALYTELLDLPELRGLSAGLVLQAYLPDSFRYQRALTHWAQARLARGGAPVRLRIVKGANLAAERVESSLRGWELPCFASKLDVDANYKRMLEFGLEPEHARAVQLGVASHNLFDIGMALTLRAAHGLDAEVSFELLEGMADPLRRTLQAVAGDVLLYCPFVEPGSMQTAIAYLMRRLDENTAPENFLHNSFGMQFGDAAWQGERQRFCAALARRAELSDAPRRQQDRRLEAASVEPATSAADGGGIARVLPSRPDPAARMVPEPHAFQNAPDTDFALPANRTFIYAELERWRTRECFDVPMYIAGEARFGPNVRDGFDPSRPGFCPYRHALASEADVSLALRSASAAARRFASSTPTERAALLRAVGRGLRRARGELIAVMLLDAGKQVEQADAEVSEASDFADYYAANYLEHAAHADYALAPKGVVVVTPPWNFPLAIPSSGTLAALMAGNAVILKPALETVLVAERLVDLCHRAGVPRDVLQLVICEDTLGSKLIRDPIVASVVLTGATSTARHFHTLRPGLDLLAETGGKNSVIMSELADRDLAIKEVLHSAFGHAGQKCSAASLLICLPEVYDDPGFREVLRDATESLIVGSAWDLRAQVTPLIQPPSGPLQRALTKLEPGERFLVEARRDPNNPRLIGPAIKLDVAAGSFTHTTELFGPLLGVLRANDLEHALALANATPYGLTAGLFSLDEREQAYWAERMQAGNLYINRGITGAVVRRQPFGGCKASSFGPGAKAGGPNYVLQLCRVSDAEYADDGAIEAPAPAAAQLLAAVRERLDPARKAQLSLAACRYAHAQRHHFDVVHDPSALIGERNEFRYRPLRLLVRAAADTERDQLLLALVAALTARAQVELSLAPPLVAADEWLARLPQCRVQVEDADAAAGRMAGIERIRQLGTPEAPLLMAASALGLHVASQAVLAAGRIELLHYLREQVVSNAYHRYGSLHAAQLR